MLRQLPLSPSGEADIEGTRQTTGVLKMKSTCPVPRHQGRRSFRPIGPMLWHDGAGRAPRLTRLGRETP